MSKSRYSKSPYGKLRDKKRAYVTRSESNWYAVKTTMTARGIK